MTTFNSTRAALVEYDRSATQRQHAWDTAVSNENIGAAERADLDALRPVQEAFYKDTKDINSLDSCLRVPIDFMRRVANK